MLVKRLLMELVPEGKLLETNGGADWERTYDLLNAIPCSLLPP